MDRYTKTTLTVIALALWALVLQNALRPSLAQQNPVVQHVAICDTNGFNCAKVVGSGGYPNGYVRQDNEGMLATRDQH